MFYEICLQLFTKTLIFKLIFSTFLNFPYCSHLNWFEKTLQCHVTCMKPRFINNNMSSLSLCSAPESDQH